MWRGRVGAAVLGAFLVLAPGEARPQGGGRGALLRVRAVWPRFGAADVLTDPVVVRFSRPVDLSTVDLGNFRVNTAGEPLHGTFSLGSDQREVVFTPWWAFHPGDPVRVRIADGITGAQGEPLAEPFLWEFRTSDSKSDGSVVPLGPRDVPRRIPRLGPPPKVTWTFPSSGLAAVYSDEILIRFDRPMATDSIDGTSFNIRMDGIPLPGAISFPEEWTNREVRFLPESPLFADSRFDMVVTRDARSARGRFLRQEFRAGFATSPFKGGVPPLRPGDFTPGPSLEVGRAFHVAASLPGGDVVLAGGEDYNGAALAATEVFHAASGAMQRVGDLGIARRAAAAVSFPDGRVLVCGGYGPLGTTLSSAEIFDPTSGTWSAAPPMRVGRARHTATLLPNGKVLVSAGYTTDGGPLAYTRTAEVYDRVLNAWTLTAAAPLVDRGAHTATLLGNGRVLLVGGTRPAVKTAEIYTPQTESFAALDAETLEWRSFHAAALTRNGTVLIAGGGPARAELFDPATGSFSDAGSCPPVALPTGDSPLYATLTALPGFGRVALLGGLSVGGGEGGGDLVLDQVQVWGQSPDRPTGGFYPMIFNLEVPRAGHTVSPLSDGSFLLAGGLGTDGVENERRCTRFKPSE
jgi:hypothetical protein